MAIEIRKTGTIAGVNRVINEDNTPIEYTGSEEEQANFIRSNVSQSKADLRTLATALESYKLDHKAYPLDLFKLTTPIAYITNIPKDPFTKSSYYKYINKGDDYVTWSIGPDLKNDDGSSTYDPAKGTKSSGDILRTAK